MSSYITPEESRRRTQQYEVDPSHRFVQTRKRKSGGSSSVKRETKKVFVQSSSSRGSQVGVNKAHVSRQQKEVELVSKVHEKEEGRNLGGDVEEIDEYIVEEEVFKVEDEVIKVGSGDSGSEEESDDSESSEDWATQYSNSIRRFFITLQQ